MGYLAVLANGSNQQESPVIIGECLLSHSPNPSPFGLSVPTIRVSTHTRTNIQFDDDDHNAIGSSFSGHFSSTTLLSLLPLERVRLQSVIMPSGAGHRRMCIPSYYQRLEPQLTRSSLSIVYVKYVSQFHLHHRFYTHENYPCGI